MNKDYIDRTSIRECPEIYEPKRYVHSRVFFKECPIAGLSFHLEKDNELWDELSEGIKVALVRDSNNKHDHNAIAIALADDYDGDPDDFDFDFILGYIPRNENAEIAAMLDAGYFDKFEAEITSYKRYGAYNDRIRITIWLTTYKPILVRPNLLRAEYLDYNEFTYFIEDLKTRGTAYVRWGGFPPEYHDFPLVGENVVILSRLFDRVYMYLMKVIADGDDCAHYLENPEDIHCCDDCVPFILANVAGPIVVERSQLSFIPDNDLERMTIDFYLKKSISDALNNIFNSQIQCFSRDNIDADPSIDDPE